MFFEKLFNRNDQGGVRGRELASSNPLDANGEVLALDDVVTFRTAHYRIVAMSHRGSVAIRHLSRRDGGGARWVPASQVEFLTSAEVAR